MDRLSVARVLWISMLIGVAVGLWTLLGQADSPPRMLPHHAQDAPRWRDVPRSKQGLIRYLAHQQGTPFDWRRLGEYHERDGEMDLAYSAYARAEQEYVKAVTAPPVSARDQDATHVAGLWYDIGILREKLDRPDEAREAFREAMELMEVFCSLRPSRVPLYNLACYAARAGEHEKAIEALERAIEAGWENYARAVADPDLAPIRDDPRVRAMLEKISPARPG